MFRLNDPSIAGAWGAADALAPRYWWQQELDWVKVLEALELDAVEVLVELEGSARELRQQALLQVLDDFVLDPGLGELWDELVALEPWEWLRSTTVCCGLERLAFGHSDKEPAQGELRAPMREGEER